MKKYLLYAAAVVIGIVAISTSAMDAGNRANKVAPTTSASATAEESSPSLTPNPEMSEDTPFVPPELSIDDLGEGNCKKFEVCTFVNITAAETCKNAEIFIDLYDDNDENYDTESVPVGTIKKGEKVLNLEVGTDDTDAAYVEQSDFICG
ncbi:MAG: hypothetical protein ORN27_09685 [Rhodoluna sp.]|nr:hypothetical protein [Rhodoluna sp.]